MTKPHVLVLSPHSGIAEGLVRLLSLEGRYDVRRASSPSQVGGIGSDWQADVVLVDGAIVRNADGMVPLPAPALLLTGDPADAARLLPRVPTAKAWLRKDPTYPELEHALTSMGASASPLRGRRARLIVAAAFTLVTTGVAAACTYLLLN